MFPTSEGSHETSHFYWSSVAPLIAETLPTACNEADSPTRDFTVGKPSIPRTSQKIICAENIKSIFERVLLTITDFFSCSGTLVTRRLAIEQDLNQLLQSPHKMKLGDWDVVFNKRCAEARWYGVDVDNIIYQAFGSMESGAANALKSICEDCISLDWLKPAIKERQKLQSDTILQLAALLKPDQEKTDNHNGGEIGKLLQNAIGAGCNIYSIVDSLISADSVHAFQLMAEASKPHGAFSSVFKAGSEAVCRKLLFDNKVFDKLLAKISEEDIDKLFGLLNPYLSGASSEKAKTVHIMWTAKNRLEKLNALGPKNTDYAKFERFIRDSGYRPNEIRRIFALAAGKGVKPAIISANYSVNSLNSYDRWLIDAQHASALSDDELVKAFGSGLYGFSTQEIEISSDDMAVLQAEAGCRAESSEADLLVTLTSAASSSILLDSVWYLLPAVLVAEKHCARMEKFRKWSFFIPKKDLGSIVENMIPADRQRIIQSLNYLSGKLKAYGKDDSAKFLEALLPKFGNFKKRKVLRKNDRTMIAGMLARHLSKESGGRPDIKFERFSPSELKGFEEGLTKSIKEIPTLSENSSVDLNNPFCEQFKIDNRGFHIWIGSEPMDGFSDRTDLERSQTIVHSLISRLQISKEQAMTVSRLCTQDISNQIILTMAEKKIFSMSPAEEAVLGWDGPQGDRSLAPMDLPMEQIVSKETDGSVTVRYFLFKDNLAKLRAAPDALLLDPEKSAFYGELMFSVQADGEFGIAGDVILGLKKTIVGTTD